MADVASWLNAAVAGMRSHPVGNALSLLMGPTNPITHRSLAQRRGQSPGIRPRASEHQARAGIRQPQPQQQQGPSASDILLQQLLGLLNQPAPTVDQNDLMRQIQGQINPVFDARAQTIRDLMSAAESRTATGRRDVEQMYGALSRDYLEMLPEVEQQSEQATQQTQNLFGELKSNLEGNYARVQQEQADLFQQLGIEEAAPAVLDDQATQQVSSLNAAEGSRAANVQRMEDIGNIDESYYRQGAPLATLEGSNRSADLLTQLNEYLGQQSSAMNELEAMRASEISSAFNQLMGQAGQGAQEQQRWQQENLLRLYMGQLEGMQGGQTNDLMPKSLQFLQQSGLGPEDQNDVWSVLAGIQQSGDVVTGRQFDPESNVPGQRTSTTTARIMQIAREAAKEAGLTPQELETLLLMIQLQYGA